MNAVIRFVFRTLTHKYYVFKFGLKTRAPLWRLVIHDWTKFTPSELRAYANKFCGPNDDQMAFALAWNHHHKSNPHHWEYFIPVTQHMKSPIKAGEPLPMPEWAIREMVADWLGASTVYQGKTPERLEDWSWYQREKGNIRLHPDSRVILEIVLGEYFGRSS